MCATVYTDICTVRMYYRKAWLVSTIHGQRKICVLTICIKCFLSALHEVGREEGVLTYYPGVGATPGTYLPIFTVTTYCSSMQLCTAVLWSCVLQPYVAVYCSPTHLCTAALCSCVLQPYTPVLQRYAAVYYNPM